MWGRGLGPRLTQAGVRSRSRRGWKLSALLPRPSRSPRPPRPSGLMLGREVCVAGLLRPGPGPVPGVRGGAVAGGGADEEPEGRAGVAGWRSVRVAAAALGRWSLRFSHPAGGEGGWGGEGAGKLALSFLSFSLFSFFLALKRTLDPDLGPLHCILRFARTWPCIKQLK